MAFTQLGLSDALVQGILATGYTAPTDIQARAIPLAVQGSDVIGLAQTGTGKTAAFVLPMLNKLAHPPADAHPHRKIRALVLTPTRELAAQVDESVKNYGQYMKFSSMTIFGGADMDRQIKQLRRGVDILIATPGRLLDHLNRRTVDLSHIEMLILDEADRMLDMGFANDVKKIIATTPSERQTLLFSATMSKGIQTLAATVQRSPELVEVGERRSAATSVTQKFYAVPQEEKSALLFHILNTVEMDSVLVFSRTKHGADKIQHRLEKQGVKAIAIHSNRTQAQRMRALEGFRRKHYKVLVATDIAARGIDIEGISHVINYDTPQFAEDYVHRIGRTGRAATTGDAITFVSRDEHYHFKKISEFVGKRFEIGRYPHFTFNPTTPTQHDTINSNFKHDNAMPQPLSNEADPIIPKKPQHKSAQNGQRRDKQNKQRFKKDKPFKQGVSASAGQAQGENAQAKKRKPHPNSIEAAASNIVQNSNTPNGQAKKPKFYPPKFGKQRKQRSNEPKPFDTSQPIDWRKMLSDEEAYNRVQRKQ